MPKSDLWLTFKIIATSKNQKYDLGLITCFALLTNKSGWPTQW